MPEDPARGSPPAFGMFEKIPDPPALSDRPASHSLRFGVGSRHSSDVFLSVWLCHRDPGSAGTALQVDAEEDQQYSREGGQPTDVAERFDHPQDVLAGAPVVVGLAAPPDH